MDWHRYARGLRILAGGSALLLASACGGGSGDKNPTGPGGGGGGGGGGDGIAGAYDMINFGGRVSLPIDIQIENCPMRRFIGGGLWLYDDGTWEMVIGYEDENGQQELDDEGDFGQDGTELSFESADYGDSFQGTVDGTVVKVDYDFCPNGQTDMQPWFQR